jgi:cytochrome b subunit of formate dehydrogenase
MIERFTRAERCLHWSLAAAIAFLMFTGFYIWNHWHRGLAIFGFRYTQAHFWVGAAVFTLAPLLFLALRRRHVAGHATRFNQGQRLNLLAMQVALPFMLATGTALHFGKAVGIPREVGQVLQLLHLGAAGLTTLAVAAHLVMVARHRHLLRGMLTGWIVSPALLRESPRSPAAPAPGSS